MMVSADNKAIAAYLRSAMGGEPRVTRYWNGPEDRYIDIMHTDDVSALGLSTIASLGLSDTSIGLTASGKELRVEILMSFQTEQKDGPNILSTCALDIMDAPKEVCPGVVFPGVLHLYRPESAMKHLLLCDPFSWDLSAQEFEGKIVAFLQAIPVSESERAYAIDKGVEALEVLLEQKDAEYTDFDRTPVV